MVFCFSLFFPWEFILFFSHDRNALKNRSWSDMDQHLWPILILPHSPVSLHGLFPPPSLWWVFSMWDHSISLRSCSVPLLFSLQLSTKQLIMLGNVVPGKLIKCQAVILKIFQMSQRINYFLHLQHYPCISHTYYLLLLKMLLFMVSEDH